LRSEPLLPPYLVLLRVGFSLPRRSPSGRCALTLSPSIKRFRDRTFSPLPRLSSDNLAADKLPHWGGIFSVALSVSARPLGRWLKRPGRPWPLASTLLCGVRTFLSGDAGAITQPAHLTDTSMKDSGMKFNRLSKLQDFVALAAHSTPSLPTGWTPFRNAALHAWTRPLRWSPDLLKG